MQTIPNIDDIIVVIERYDKLVAEILQRLEKNDLYMKLKKYK